VPAGEAAPAICAASPITNKAAARTKGFIIIPPLTRCAAKKKQRSRGAHEYPGSAAQKYALPPSHTPHVPAEPLPPPRPLNALLCCIHASGISVA
jgi:hypothetical protein